MLENHSIKEQSQSAPMVETFETLPQALLETKRQIEPLLASNNIKQPHVIVFDIDDTILFPKTGYKIENGIVHMSNDTNNRASVKRNDDMFEFYTWARRFSNVRICFITARIDDESNRLSTQKQLVGLGYDTYHHLFLMPTSYLSMWISSTQTPAPDAGPPIKNADAALSDLKDPAKQAQVTNQPDVKRSAGFSFPVSAIHQIGKAISRFKWAQRYYLQTMCKYHVLLNVGDQWQDLVIGGTFGTHGELLAQKIYLLRFGSPEPSYLSLKLPSRSV